METGIILAAVILGGIIKGLTGFGYALVSTALLATAMPTQEAVALMIIPLIVSNLELASETNIEELKTCSKNFSTYILFLIIGTTIGMLAIDQLPDTLLKRTVGLIAVIFAVAKTNKLSTYFERIKKTCFKSQEPLIGIFSGIIYGATNTAILTIAYLKSRNLHRQKFVGTLAVIILAASIYRIFLAQATGAYANTEYILYSLLISLPGVLSVKIGSKASGKLENNKTNTITLLLILIIGLRLLTF